MVVARCNGMVLVEDGAQLGCVERGGGWLGTARFVALLLAVILGSNGAVFMTIEPIAGLVLLAGAALAVAITVALWRAHRRRAAAPPGPPWLIFDRAAGVLRRADGTVLAPLAQVQLGRSWQVGSSSKALVVRYGPDKLVLARGTPFGDAIDEVEHALVARGMRQG